VKVKVVLNYLRDMEQLKNSIFSKSLDEQKVVNIKGRAKKVNGVIKQIIVD
jgi:hypothetical protein